MTSQPFRDLTATLAHSVGRLKIFKHGKVSNILRQQSGSGADYGGSDSKVGAVDCVMTWEPTGDPNCQPTHSPSRRRTPWRAGDLPAHHADPFDRMLIAQARVEGLTLITVDDRFAEYEVNLLPTR